MLSVPEILDDELLKRADRIKPVIKNKGALWFIRQPDLRKVAFLWSPSFTHEAPRMKPLREVSTLHTFGYVGFFKPSIAEVLAQVPDDILHQACAFEITKMPLDVDDLDSQATRAGFHRAITQFYSL